MKNLRWNKSVLFSGVVAVLVAIPLAHTAKADNPGTRLGPQSDAEIAKKPGIHECRLSKKKADYDAVTNSMLRSNVESADDAKVQ